MKLQMLILLLGLCLTACGVQATNDPSAKKVEQVNLLQNVNGKVNKSNVSVDKKRKANQTETKMIDKSNLISMKAKAEKSGDKLLIEYEIENHSDQKLYLWDRMIAYKGGEQFIDEELAYVFFEEPKIIRIVRANLPLPFDRDVARKEIPFARAIEAAAKVTGKIVLSVPAKEFSPFYRGITEENSLIQHCREIRLLIGWSELREGMQIQERTVGDEKVLAIRGGWKEPYHKLLEQKIPLEVDLKVHKDAFDRSMPLH
jgi:hypothetical protein